MRRWVPWVAVVLFGGCYILIDEGGAPTPPPPVPQPYPVQVPVPVPVPVPRGGPSPLPLPLDDGGLAVWWLFRFDANTPNLVASYERLMQDVDDALKTRGITASTQVVGSLHDARLLWGRTIETAAPVPVEAMLRYYAEHPPGQTMTCTTHALAQMGASLGLLTVDYPDELLERASKELPGEARPIEVKDALQPFLRSPGALVVILVDPGPRPLALTEPGCARNGMTPSAWFGGSSPVVWARFSDGRQLLREQTRFALIATPEGVDSATARAQCASVASFPREAIDVVAPSGPRFFDRFDEDLRPLTERFDFCRAVGGQWDPGGFADRFLETLQQVRPIER